MKINLELITNRICEELCFQNDGCAFKGNCIECMNIIAKMIYEDNPVSEE